MMAAIVEANAGDQTTQLEDIPHLQPPLDVVMVWHTFLLNPGWYEDAVRKAYPEDPEAVNSVLGQEFPWVWIVSRLRFPRGLGRCLYRIPSSGIP